MNPLGLPSRRNNALQRGDKANAGLFALSHTVFHFILTGNFDRNANSPAGLARRLRLHILSVVRDECFAQTSVFSCGRHLGQAGQNYLIAFA
jgi:hypothetical protein